MFFSFEIFRNKVKHQLIKRIIMFFDRFFETVLLTCEFNRYYKEK